MAAYILFSVCIGGIMFLLWVLVNLCRDRKTTPDNRAVRVFPEEPTWEGPWMTPFPGTTYDYRNRSLHSEHRVPVAALTSYQDVWDE
jgi:hypothetical protein